MRKRLVCNEYFFIHDKEHELYPLNARGGAGHTIILRGVTSIPVLESRLQGHCDNRLLLGVS